MAGTYPLEPYFESVDFKINTPSLTAETFSGLRQRVGQGHSYYTWTVKYPQVRQRDFGVVLAFVAQQYGPLESFQIVLPEISYPEAADAQSLNGQVRTASSATTGAKQVNLTNCGNSKEVLRAGDYFRFGIHGSTGTSYTKVYMCASGITSSAAGTATLYFSGSLVNDIPANTPLTLWAVPFTATLDNDVQQYSIGVGGLSTAQLDMREAW